ncbi:hypothetical protein [Pseudoalteromonas viridis]|uniref:Uncharacterized protein n=1 Tax=Pseudoalteromonas viridis TaxID=339617 RepID=A0ABX7V9V9_9GAMM|nr:hypothetical protein [Pseudoalteromonas viridis]QTL37709.1 hypothetical protein J5X90_23005 [Pseudoalteromonas viridis]
MKRETYLFFKKLATHLNTGQIVELEKALSILSPIAQTIKGDATDLLVETTVGQSTRRSIASEVRQAIAMEKSLNYRRLIVEVHQLESLLREYPTADSRQEANFICELLSSIDEFMENYDSHNRNYNENSFIPVALSALELKRLMITVGYLAIDNSLVTNNQEPMENVPLELYLPNVTTLKAFAAKLKAIDEMYTELLHLYGESTSDYPIIIEHIENGSLWVKIAGHSLTSTALAIIMTSAAGYYQDNFTASGKLKQLPSSVQTVNELLKISALLEKDGVDTSDIKENIASATRKMSHQLDELLGDQPVVEVNEKVVKLSDSQSQKLIEATMKSLPYNDL